MRKTIIFVSLPEFAHYLRAIAGALEERGYAPEIVAPQAALADLDRLAGAALVGTIHSVLAEVRDVMAALNGRVPTLTLQDGIIEHRHAQNRARGDIFRYRPLHTDRIAAFGARSAGLLAAYGVAPERVVPTGSCRFSWTPPLPAPPDGGHLLVTAANRPAFEPAGTAAFYRLLDRILSVCAEQGIPFRLRRSRGMRGRHGLCRIETAQPPLDPEIVRRLRAVPASEDSLETDLSAARAVLTTPSTVSLEAMARGLPVGHILFDDETVYLHPPWSVRPGSDIAAVLHEMMRPPASKMMYQDALLRENLMPGDAVARIAAHMAWMIDNRDRLLAPAEP